jgi:hypothetical protein
MSILENIMLRPSFWSLICALLLSPVCYASKLTELQAQAEGGDPAAQLELGELYLKGKDVEKNPALAVEWIRKAANQGHGPAVVSMVYRYEKGEGVEQNLGEATRWYEQALEMGYDRRLNKSKPLSDYAAQFAECDARLRAIDPANTTCTNYVEWMQIAIKSLDELGQEKEIDPWLEELSASGTNNWKLLHAVAMGYQSAKNCYGYDPFKEAEDGHNVEGRNSWLSLRKVDRAFRLMMQAPPTDAEQALLIRDYFMLLMESRSDAPQWLQVKTIDHTMEEVSTPTFWENIPERIVFFERPESYETAISDGEMLWWLAGLQDLCIEGVTIPKQLQPALLAFLLSELMTDDDDALNAEEEDVLVRLADDEMGVWSNGVLEPLQLPENYAFIPELLSQRDAFPELAYPVLAGIFKNRFQLERAAQCYELAGETNVVRSIRTNQGVIENCPPFAVGTDIHLDYRYRNGSEAEVSIFRICAGSNLVERLENGEVLQSELDLLAGWPYLFRKSGRLEQTNMLKSVTSFTLALEPKSDHRDASRRIDLPPLESGNYLARVQMKDGNKAETIVNVYDSSLYCYELASASITNEHAVLLLSDARTGQPLPQHAIDLYLLDGGVTKDPRGKWVDDAYSVVQRIQAMTDEQGCYVLDTALCQKPEDKVDYATFALVNDGGKQPMVSQVQWSGFSHYSYPEKPFVTTDRPIYRPGDTVHLKLWKYLNTEPEELKIADRRQSLLTRATLKPDRFGSADMHITIPPEAPLGQYSIESAGDEYATCASFFVEKYRTPEFAIKMEQLEPGQFEVRATYAYGEPVANARAQISIFSYETASNYWYPQRRYDSFWAPGYWWVGGQLSEKQKVDEERFERADFRKQINIRLDAYGRSIVDLADFEGGMEAYRNWENFGLEVKVTDAAEKQIELKKNFSNTEKEQRLCIWLDKANYEPSEEIVCQWASKNPLPKVAIALGRVDGANTVSVMQMQAEDHEVSLGQLEPGLYELLALSTDQQPSQPFRFIVLGKDTLLTPENPIRLVREKGLYDVSDPATVLLQVDRPGRWVYFFDHVAAGNTYSYPSIIYMDETSKRVSFPLERAGLIQCAAVTIVDGQPHLVDCRLPVADRSINAGYVSITPDKDAYRPGETIHLDLQAFDQNQQGKACAITVSVYKKLLDTLLAEYLYYHPNIYSPLFSSWRYTYERDLDFSDDRARFISATAPDWVMEPLGWQRYPRKKFHAEFSAGQPRFRANISIKDWFGGKTLGSRNIMRLCKPKVIVNTPLRKDFRDTAYWNALVETDEEGKAFVEFTMPDSLTEWKVEAWAMHTNYAGDGEATMVCKKDFVVQLNTPRFMVEGDTLEVSGSVRNHTEETMTVDTGCTVDSAAIEVSSSATGRIDALEAGAEGLCYWNTTAAEAGTATVTIAAQSGATSDGMEHPIPVLPHSMLKRGARSGVLAGERREERVVIDIPEAIDPETLQLEVNATDNLLQSVAGALPYLADYPHGCTEQTLNRFLPSVTVLQTLDRLGISMNQFTASMPKNRHPVFDRSEIIKRAQTGIDKLENASDYDGLWSWNLNAYSPRDFMISAWVYRGLIMAAGQSDLSVNTPALSMEEFIQQIAILMQPPWRQKKPVEVNDAHAFMTAVIHESDWETMLEDSKEQNLRLTAEHAAPFLMKHASELSLYGKILLAYTFELRGEAEPRDELIRYIDQYRETDPELGTHWLRMPNSDWWRWYNDPIEACAWYLKLLNRVEPQSTKTAGLARYLMLNREHGDHWKSTRDTAICIEALCEFIVNNPPEQDAGAATILLNGKPWSDQNPLRIGRNELVFTTTGTSALFYDAAWSYQTFENPITAETSELISVSRAYFRIDPETGEYRETPMAEGEILKAGETIQVKLTLQAAQELEYVLAQDFKPAGFECTDTGSGYQYDSLLRDYRELHDERIACYIDHVPKGESTIAYLLRAEHAGSVCAMPATVELMYAPQQAANTQENRLKTQR